MKAPAIIKEARLRAGLTQAELARKLETTQSVVARWEVGDRSPSLETIERIARACDLDVSIFLTTHDDHDLRHAQRMKKMLPGERIKYMVDAQRNVSGLVRRAKRVRSG
jgi:transcriptional regulator with XRE-family HTH domain